MKNEELLKAFSELDKKDKLEQINSLIEKIHDSLNVINSQYDLNDTFVLKSIVDAKSTDELLNIIFENVWCIKDQTLALYAVNSALNMQNNDNA